MIVQAHHPVVDPCPYPFLHPRFLDNLEGKSDQIVELAASDVEGAEQMKAYCHIHQRSDVEKEVS